MTASAVLLVLTAALALTSAANKASGKGSCPELPAMASFNASAMSGVWYDIAHTNRRTGLKLKCDVVKFTEDKTNPNQLNFHSFSYSSATKNTVNLAGSVASVTKRNSSPDGKLTAKIPSLNIDGPEVRVLSTDYTTFAVLYACLEQDDDTFSGKALVLTRDRNPSTKLKNAAYKVLENNNISKRDLSATSQTKCHDYDLSSTTETQASTLGHGTSMGGLLSPPTPAQLAAAVKPTRKPAQKPSKN